MTPLLLAAAISTTLVAGIFFAFSAIVMPALDRLDQRPGMAAMQSINLVVLNTWFFGAFFGAGVLCVFVAFGALQVGSGPNPALAILGAALYLLGCIGVTGVRNVPLNNRLARAEGSDPERGDLWRLYVARWTRWNHVRTGAALGAACLFVLEALHAC